MDIPSTTTEINERRSEERVATVYRPALIETDEFAGFCLVRNLSAIGMMAQVYASLSENTALQIGFGDTLTVPGHVVWCREDKIGIKFDVQIDVDEVLTGLSSRSYRGNAKRAPRLPLQVKGEVVLEDRCFPIELQDISQKGLKVRTGSLKTDDEVTVSFPGLEPRKAIVRWTQSGMAGLNFVRPLPYDQLGEWVIKQQIGASSFTQPVMSDVDPEKSRAA